jgi:dTDP-4-dehydrorhamnose reductase
MTRWLITGGTGMVATDLRAALHDRDVEVIAPGKADLDITDFAAVKRMVDEQQPSVIINCAAYTKVDAAEENENLATAINGSAVELLARAAGDALLVQLSTDFVFDGSKRTPYEINDPTSPLSAYGRSKLLGEQSVMDANRFLLVRTSWLFGVNGPNFVEAIRKQIVKGNSLRVVDDQRGRPTYTPHLADAIVRLISCGATGIVHYADAPECTWYDFARAIAEEMGSDVPIEPVSTAEFPRPATRPAYSVLSTERYEHITGVAPARWRDGLREYFDRLKPVLH